MSINWSNKTQYELFDMNSEIKIAEKFQEISQQDIILLLKNNYSALMASFYETQSSFLSEMYKKYNSIETANIILSFTRNVHLEIIRQREKNLNFNISADNFLINFNHISTTGKKITSIVNHTGIPKETVRRKVKKLVNKGFLIFDKNKKEYSWALSKKEKDSYNNIIIFEIQILSRFISKFVRRLNLGLNMNMIQKEMKSKFSFYWFHFLSCQLEWLKMWQLKIKDADLLLIALQSFILSLQYTEKIKQKNVNTDNIFKLIGKIKHKYDIFPSSVSATSVSDVTGIPRATCIRKIEKLVSMGFLTRQSATKRYSVNQDLESRTRNFLTKDNVDSTIEIFSRYIAIILSNLIVYNKK